MNKYLSLGIAFFFILTLGLSITARHYYNEAKAEKASKERTIELLGNTTKDLEIYTNAYNHLVTKNESQILDQKTLQQLIKEGNLPFVKELEGVKKSLKNVEFLYKTQIEISDSLRSKLDFITKNYINEKGDTVSFSAFKWGRQHNWGFDSLVQITPDSVLFTEKEIVPLAGAMYWERKIPILWILSKKEYKSEIYSENPNVKITELLNIKVTKRK